MFGECGGPFLGDVTLKNREPFMLAIQVACPDCTGRAGKEVMMRRDGMTVTCDTVGCRHYGKNYLLPMIHLERAPT